MWKDNGRFQLAVKLTWSFAAGKRPNFIVQNLMLKSWHPSMSIEMWLELGRPGLAREQLQKHSNRKMLDTNARQVPIFQTSTLNESWFHPLPKDRNQTTWHMSSHGTGRVSRTCVCVCACMFAIPVANRAVSKSDRALKKETLFYQFISLLISLSLFLSVYFSVYPSDSPSAYLSVYLSV